MRNVLAAFATRIDRLDWMAPATKAKAKAKLAALEVGVGYPDKWRDYSGLEVVRGDAFGNAERAELFEYRRNLAKLGQPVDRGEWVDEAAAGQRGQPAGDERAQLSRPRSCSRRSSTRSGRRGHGLRRHRRHHRPRDQPQLRRPGRAVRRQRPPAQLVDAGGLRPLQGVAGARLVGAVRRLPPVPRPRASTASRRSARTSPTSPGSSVAYDAYRLSLGGKAAPAAAGSTATSSSSSASPRAGARRSASRRCASAS